MYRTLLLLHHLGDEWQQLESRAVDGEGGEWERWRTWLVVIQGWWWRWRGWWNVVLWHCLKASD